MCKQIIISKSSDAHQTGMPKEAKNKKKANNIRTKKF